MDTAKKPLAICETDEHWTMRRGHLLDAVQLLNAEKIANPDGFEIILKGGLVFVAFT